MAKEIDYAKLTKRLFGHHSSSELKVMLDSLGSDVESETKAMVYEKIDKAIKRPV